MQGNFICLLGFSKSTEDRIKAMMKEYSVPSLTWTTATAKELTGVVINASFLDTPQIHKYIKVVKAPVVSAYNTDAGHESAREYSNIPALDLRTNDENTIKNWLSKLLGSNYSTTNTSSPKNQGTQSSSYRELLDLILSKKNTTIRAEHNDSIAWISPSEETVFINYPRENTLGIEKWQWMEVNASDIPDSARQLKLDLWLFESLWQSDSPLSEEIKSESYYQMIRWPQPLSKSGRSQALRLAASAQHSPINAKILQEKTHYDLDLIRKFLYATENAGQAKAISNKEADNAVINKVAVKQENKEVVEQKKGLLSRLRKTLGF